MATASKKTQAQLDADAEQARRDRINGDDEAPPRSEVHTYPDGSQRVGVPPFPEKSPIEEAADGLERTSGPRPMHVPHGMPQSGEKAPDPAVGTTADEFRAKVQQQLESDVAAGKDPNTVNPTTSSDKPELAGTSGLTGDQLETTVQPLTQDEIESIARQIKPEGNVDATPEQVDAAVTQVVRETRGPIPDLSAKGKTDAKKSK